MAPIFFNSLISWALLTPYIDLSLTTTISSFSSLTDWITKFSPEIILLDDGFQSLYIKKHTDCVLIDLSLPTNQYSLLPVGRLREPLSSIQRANLVVFIKKHIFFHHFFYFLKIGISIYCFSYSVSFNNIYLYTIFN